MSKLELTGREILTDMAGGTDPLEAGVGTVTDEVGADDAATWVQLIVDAILQIIEAWSANCQQKTFSSLAKNPGFAGGMKARQAIRRSIRDHRQENGPHRVSDVWRSSKRVLASKDDEWLNSMAAEPDRPDWGI